jgi:hypothetical protein
VAPGAVTVLGPPAEVRGWSSVALYAMAAIAKIARLIFDAVERARDKPTADLLTQQLQVHKNHLNAARFRKRALNKARLALCEVEQ